MKNYKWAKLTQTFTQYFMQVSDLNQACLTFKDLGVQMKKTNCAKKCTGAVGLDRPVVGGRKPNK